MVSKVILGIYRFFWFFVRGFWESRINLLSVLFGIVFFVVLVSCLVWGLVSCFIMGDVKFTFE